MVGILTDPSADSSGEFISASAHGLDDRIHKWVDTKHSEIQNFARAHITNEACKNTVDLWASEAVIHRIDACCHEIDQKTDASFDVEKIEKRRLACLAELEILASKHIAAEEICLQEMVSSRIGSLKHEAKVKIRDVEDDISSRLLTLVIHSGKQPKPSLISARTRSKKTPKK
jgi:hypothetical protein